MGSAAITPYAAFNTSMQSAVLISPVRLLAHVALIAALGCALLLPAPARAAELTEAQIQAIVGLLRSFDAEPSVLTNTENALRNKPEHSDPIPSPATTTPINTEERKEKSEVVRKPAIKDFSATPSKIASGESTTLTWTVERTAQCGVSPVTEGAPAIDLTKSTVASNTTMVPVGPFTHDAKYELRCAPLPGVKNESAYAVKRVEVKVRKPIPVPAPTCKLNTNKDAYKVGDTATVTWTSKNATGAIFSPNTSEEGLQLPGGKLDASGNASVLITGIGRLTITLNVFNQTATTTCMRTIKVTSTVSAFIDATTLAANAIGSAVVLVPLQGAVDSFTSLLVYAGVGQPALAAAVQTNNGVASSTTVVPTVATTTRAVKIVPLPTCQIKASPNKLLYGQSTTLSWHSERATSAVWGGDTSGKDTISLPTGVPGVKGTLTFTPSLTEIVGGSQVPSVTLTVMGPGGMGKCSAYFTVSSPTRAEFDRNTFRKDGSATPTIAGKATGLLQVEVLLKQMSATIYSSGLIAVINGKWSTTVSPPLAPGAYMIYVNDPKGNNLLNGGYLMVGDRTATSTQK